MSRDPLPHIYFSEHTTGCGPVSVSFLGQKLLVVVEMSQSVPEIVRCNDFEFALH